MSPVTLTPKLVRRLAISCQRLAGPYPKATADGMMDVIQNLGCVQIDPIRTVERSQFLVLRSRMGNYDPEILDTLLWQKRSLFEYWAHAASIVLTQNYPIHQVQMRRFASGNSRWSQRVRTWLAENKEFRRYILTRLRNHTPLAADEFEDRATTPWESGGWTNDRNVGQMIYFLWSRGDIMVVERHGLKKKWALTKQCLPEWTPREKLSDHQATYRAAQQSLRSLGVATIKHINNHFIRGSYLDLKNVLTQLVDEGSIIPVSIRESKKTWPGDWYIHADNLKLLERLSAGKWKPRTTLLSPFDNLICDRERTESIWDFHFRLETYIPKSKRQYGHYVLPILHGDQLIGRIDPKMERKNNTLQINAVYSETGAPRDTDTIGAIADAITQLGLFLGARNIVYGNRIPRGWRKVVG